MTPQPPASLKVAPPSRSDRPLLVVGLLAISSLGWGFLSWMALDMSHPLAQLMMPSTSAWTAATSLAMLLMWTLMMGAMMLPSALPMLLTFSKLSAGASTPLRTWAFVAAYVLVWFGASLLAMVLQWSLQRAGWLNPMITSTSALLSSVLLLMAGLYQFSPLKQMCLAQCRSPIGFLMGNWHAGVGGAFQMGFAHGLLCVGCCWALMVLLFVGGVMNIAWIAAVALAVAVEKLAPGGDTLGRLLGAALMLAGLWRLATSLM